MNTKIVLLVFVTIFISAQCSKKILDRHLQEFRKEYRKFRGINRLLLDQSFFEIYNAIGQWATEFQKPFEQSIEKWHKICSEYSTKGINNSIKKSFSLICENVNILLKTNFRHKVLESFFSGKLLKLSPPLEIFDDLCAEIEINIENLWTIYEKNKTCIRKELVNVIPLSFNSFINQILNLTNVTINQIEVDYDHCKYYREKAITYIDNFIKAIESCKLQECLKKLLLREIDCSGQNCGRLYSSIRSSIFSIIETTKIFKHNYKKDLENLADVEELAENKIDQWLKSCK